MSVTWISEDWGYPPIEIESGEQGLVVVEYDPGSGTTDRMDLTIPTGKYWCCHAFQSGSPQHDSLFDVIETALNNNSPNGLNYVVSAAPTTDLGDASSATSDRDIGVSYDNQHSTIETYFEFGDTFEFTFPSHLLGWPRNYTTDAAAAVVKNGSPRSNFGRWTPMVRRQNDGAARKPPPRIRRRQARSDEDRKRAYTLQVDETRRQRTIEYQDVGATSIQRHRADLAGYPELDRVVSGEENNALNDHLADAANFDEWLWVHDNPSKPLHPYRSDGSQAWEHAALIDANDSDNLIDQSGVSPEQFTVTVEYEIRSGEYDQ